MKITRHEIIPFEAALDVFKFLFNVKNSVCSVKVRCTNHKQTSATFRTLASSWNDHVRDARPFDLELVSGTFSARSIADPSDFLIEPEENPANDQTAISTSRKMETKHRFKLPNRVTSKKRQTYTPRREYQLLKLTKLPASKYVNACTGRGQSRW